MKLGKEGFLVVERVPLCTAKSGGLFAWAFGVAGRAKKEYLDCHHIYRGSFLIVENA